MSFSLVIEHSSVKLLRSAISNLYNINCDYVGFQVFQDRVLMKSVDDAESAMMAIQLFRTFFSEYSVHIQQVQQSQQAIEAIVNIRDVLVVLRNRKINKMEIKYSEQSSSILTFLASVQPDAEGIGSVRKYQLSLLEGIELQDVEEDTQSFPTCVVVQPTEMQRILALFKSKGEVCILVNPNKQDMPVGLMGYVSPLEARVMSKIQRNILITDAQQLFKFEWHRNTQEPSEATFLVNQFQALLQLCVDLQCNVKLFIGEPGRMMIAIPEPSEPHQEVVMGAALYLATLETSLADQMEPILRQQQQQHKGQQQQPMIPSTAHVSAMQNTGLQTPQEMMSDYPPNTGVAGTSGEEPQLVFQETQQTQQMDIDAQNQQQQQDSAGPQFW